MPDENYVPLTDEALEGAIAAGMQFLRKHRDDGSNGSGTADGQTGWHPFRDVLDLDASQYLPDPALSALAWKERVSIVSAEPKAGKSTLIAQAVVAAVAGDRFVDRTVSEVATVAIVTEEPMSLLAARLRRYGLDERFPARVYTASPREGLDKLLAAFARCVPAVIVIDSLTSWTVQSRAESMNDPVVMRRLVEQLRAFADLGSAVLLVHHGRKSDGMLRDSVDIAAAVDMLVSFDPIDPEGNVVRPRQSNLRRLMYLGRWPMDDIVLGFNNDGRYFVTDAGHGG